MERKQTMKNTGLEIVDRALTGHRGGGRRYPSLNDRQSQKLQRPPARIKFLIISPPPKKEGRQCTANTTPSFHLASA